MGVESCIRKNELRERERELYQKKWVQKKWVERERERKRKRERESVHIIKGSVEEIIKKLRKLII